MNRNQTLPNRTDRFDLDGFTVQAVFFFFIFFLCAALTNQPSLFEFEPQASPCIRFNKQGFLLAVSTNDNGIKILANADGNRVLRMADSRSFDASRAGSAAVVKVKWFATFSRLYRNYMISNNAAYVRIYRLLHWEHLVLLMHLVDLAS